MMPIRWIAKLAVVGWILAVVGGLASIVIRRVTDAPILPNTFGLGEGSFIGLIVLGITWTTVGAWLVVRRPDNAVGRYMVIVGFGNAVSMLTSAVTFVSATSDPGLSGSVTRVFAWLTVVLSTMGGLFFFLAFVFPTGRGHTPRWETVRRVALYGFLVGATVLAFQPGSLHLFPGIDNPFGFGPDLRGSPDDPVSGLVLVGVVVILPILVIAVVSRYRMADRIERAQLKWYILSNAVAVGGVTLAELGVAIRRGPADEVGLLVFTWVGSLVPLAIGVAILRHHLYNIDRLVSRTIAYTGVSAVLLATFTGLVLGLTAVSQRFIEGSTVAVATSTLIVFALFQPVRRRIQGAVDRRFDRARYDARGDRCRVLRAPA